MGIPGRRTKFAFVSITAIICAACQSATFSSLDCRFHPVQLPEDELSNCAFVNENGAIVLRPATVSEIRRRNRDPIALWIDSKLYYVNSRGRIAPVLPFDNGADYFVEDLARSPHNGKIGFIDSELFERIPPTWDFAFPFSKGVALVCQGCRPHSVGDHTEMRGGKWGYINREGIEVVPVRFDKPNLPGPPQQ